MDETKNVYCSFMLRIWIENADGEQWRFSLEDTRTGKRQGFASLKKLMAYLTEITETEDQCQVEN